MRALSSSELLDLWERGGGLRPLDQALLALSAALPDVAPETLADWPLGRRNHALLEMYRFCFGPHLQAWSGCAQCGEQMEFRIDSRALINHASGANAETVSVGGYSFRLPSSRDLAAAAREREIGLAGIRILERCQLSGAKRANWSEEELNQIEASMALCDPLAETRLALRCPTCDHEAEETLDIVGLVWSEIASHANRLLREIHSLASAYGWTESQVLSLSAYRRARYLEMVEA